MSNNSSTATLNIADLSGGILDQLPTTVMAVDKNMNMIYLNKSGEKILGEKFKKLKGRPCSDIFCSEHCNTDQCRMKQSIESGRSLTARNSIEAKGVKVPIEYFTAPLTDEKGDIIGGLEYVLDISERVKQENRLRDQNKTIREISTPAIKLWEGIVVLPVIGIVDSARAQQMMETMLEKIVETTAKVMILDISGVAALDTAVANHLIKITKATKLMGCVSIISGVSPSVAQTIVTLGINMDGIYTKSTLNDALEEAFKIINLEVKAVSGDR